ncbi:MAG: MmgE/PrpD family protein, partial [Proteobacteria bacterium]|nr:MmgE/PrpD family protein [Pseudomonadota bacterium]
MTGTHAPISPPMARLSAHMAAAASATLPDPVAAKTKHHILDTLAAMVSGTRLKPGRLATAYVAAQGGNEEAQVPGTAILTTARNAALAGGMCAHADETDDSHPGAFFHPGCAVVPAALAMAERAGASGARLINAVALGYDVGARINLALDVERFYGKNNFSTHSFGALFGAAAAAAALAGLDAAQCRWMLSFTAQQASGLGCWARDTEHVEKAFDFGGMGAEHGVAAATMVEAGMTGLDDVFSGPRNFFAAFGGTPERIAQDLGQVFEIMNADIKKWSVGSPCQALLDSLEALMAEHGLSPGAVTKMEARVPAVEAHVVDDREMPDICLQHLLALLLIDGGLSFDNTHDYARMDDPELRALRGKITLVADAALPRRAGTLAVERRDGGALAH